jgi:hypothetical protein
VKDVVFSTLAAAVLKEDGSVLTWGDAYFGGDSSSVAEHLKSGVSKVVMGKWAGAVLKEDGSVWTWGHGPAGGDSSEVAEHLRSGVKDVVMGNGNGGLAAALKEDGSVIGWGDVTFAGPDMSAASVLIAAQVTERYYLWYAASGVAAAVASTALIAAWKNAGTARGAQRPLLMSVA